MNEKRRMQLERRRIEFEYEAEREKRREAIARFLQMFVSVAGIVICVAALVLIASHCYLMDR